MNKKLDYQSPKWEKELKNKEKEDKQFNGQSATLVNLQRILKLYQEKESSLRDYRMLYENLQLKYKLLANNCYLRDTDDWQCIDYTYLSGTSGILAKLYDTPEKQKGRHTTDAKNAITDFDFAVLQMFATDQPLPKCVQNMDHIYVQLLSGNFEKVNALFQQLGTKFDPSKPDKPWASERTRADIQAVMKKHEKFLRESLIARIKEYRKAPVGYSTFIDIYSIAFIKLAKQYGMNCEIDVIEIPKIFFAEERCKIDQTVKLPFFDEATAALKECGIEY